MSQTVEELAEAAQDRRWSSWWREDYSWQGLAKKRWRGWSISRGKPVLTFKAPKSAKLATLQDFWRAEEGRLTPCAASPVIRRMSW